MTLFWPIFWHPIFGSWTGNADLPVILANTVKKGQKGGFGRKHDFIDFGSGPHFWGPPKNPDFGPRSKNGGVPLLDTFLVIFWTPFLRGLDVNSGTFGSKSGSKKGQCVHEKGPKMAIFGVKKWSKNRLFLFEKCPQKLNACFWPKNRLFSVPKKWPFFQILDSFFDTPRPIYKDLGLKRGIQKGSKKGQKRVIFDPFLALFDPFLDPYFGYYRILVVICHNIAIS